MHLCKRLPYILQLFCLLAALNLSAQEICDNGIDDDNNGLVDLKDPGCQCRLNVSGNLLQNASFESFNHCPVNYTYFSDSNIADHWQYGTYTNSNEAWYYHNLSCTYDSSQIMEFIPPSLPLPDGKAFMSIRQYVYRKANMQETDIAKTYIGQCLQSPLTPGEQYTLTFSAGRFQSNDDSDFKYKMDPITVALFGHSNCNAVPFGETYAHSNGCPANYQGWILLGKIKIASNGEWVQGRIDFKVPHDINTIQIGPDCSLLNPSTELPDSTTLLDYYVYFLDDFHLLPTKAFHFPHIQGASGDPCLQDSLLNAPAFPNASYQWYKDSIAIAGATGMQYLAPKNNGLVTYNVRIVKEGACAISEPYVINRNELARLQMPADTLLCNGDQLQLVPALEGVSYTWNGNRSDNVQVSKAGIYQITAQANDCIKVFTVNVKAVDCTNSNLYIPNAFTPNGDGINDVFRVPPELPIKVIRFSVFDRWGHVVFSTTGNGTGWDGTCNGKESPPGTYVYYIKGVVGTKERIMKGVVVLIR